MHIIYCLSRADTERVAAMLVSHGFDAVAYHAGLPNEERKRRQEAFVRDDVRIVVATIAFGMGIDKPDVRFVVHYDCPRNLEGYYQESGRAGRDGEPADCILLYSYADLARQEHFIKQKESEAEQTAAYAQLRRITNWAAGVMCRRRNLLAYFDESFDRQEGRCCDVCSRSAVLADLTAEQAAQPEGSPNGGTPALEDLTTPAQMLLSCVVRTEERFGTTYVIDVLRGSREERVLRLGHDKLSTHGIGRDRPKDDWQHLVRHLIERGYLIQEPEYLVLKLTDRGRTALLKREPILLPPFPNTKPSPAPTAVDLPATHQPLFERLRTLRKRLADERAVPPYVVFPDRVLAQMAATLPSTPSELLRISGVGEHKALDFGQVFLAEIAEHRQSTGLEAVAELSSAPPRAPSRPRLEGLSPTVRRTLELFREGLSLAEISRKRSLSDMTVEEHLATAIEEGEEVDLNRLVSPRKQDAIRAAMAGLGPSPLLRPIMERLDGDYTYGEIRLVRAAAVPRPKREDRPEKAP